MIPREAKRGRSFKGWFLYHMHDKKAATRQRVGWTHTLNMLTDDVEKAWKVMAYTAKSAGRLKEVNGNAHTGRRLQFPVFAYSLSWHPDESPDQAQMLDAAHRSIKALGMGDYEGLVVEHTDTPHPHIHIVLNRVHPITGLTADNGQTKRKLSAFALEWEYENGVIFCPQRKENHDMQENGKKTIYRDPIIRDAWEQSSNGREFKSKLEAKNYHLAQGRKRLVIVDAYGKIHSPTRHLDGMSAKDFTKRLNDLDLPELEDAEAVSQRIQQDRKGRYEQSRAEREMVSLAQKEQQDTENLSRTFNRLIDRKRRELEEAYRLSQQQNIIAAQEAKIKKSNLLTKAFGFHSYRKYKLAKLRKTFSEATSAIEKALHPYIEEKQTALDDLKKTYAQHRSQWQNDFD